MLDSSYLDDDLQLNPKLIIYRSEWIFHPSMPTSIWRSLKFRFKQTKLVIWGAAKIWTMLDIVSHIPPTIVYV